MASPDRSNIALYQMMMHYKEQAEAEQRELEARTAAYIKNYNTLHGRLLHAEQAAGHAQDELNNAIIRINQMAHAGEILVRANDDLYALITAHGDTEMRHMAQRSMMRADIGFAILQGAPFVDLTAEERMAGAETPIMSDTETESESELV